MTSAAPSLPTDDDIAHAKRTMELLAQQHISPTPENYAVWFHYTQGKNRELLQEIERNIAAGLPFTRSTCAYLYNKYVLADTHKAVDAAAVNAQKVLQEVLKTIQGFSGETQSYNKNVDQYMETVSKKFEGTGVEGIVRELITATASMKNSGEKITKKLEESTKEITNLKKNLQQVTTEAQRDFLTGVFNRKRFETLFEENVAAARQSKTPLCLLMIDIDHFKKFNDRFGHLLGDEVLKTVARTLTDTLKGRDVVARFGGEEFVAILPETPIEGAMKVADIIRNAMASKELKRRDTNEHFGTITISVGVALLRPEDTLTKLIKRADDALYQAKRHGRNCVMREAV